MPDFKVMGTLPEEVSKKITNMVVNKQLDHNDDIVGTIVRLLGSQIKNVKADLLVAPIEGKFQISTNYSVEDPVGVFYVISEGSLTLQVGKKTIDMVPNKIYFVNDRNTYRVFKTNENRTCVLSGVFAWDKDKHGSS